ETTGGCVYDGLPLPGVTIDIVDGRIEVEGGQVAAGYRDGSDGFSGDAPRRRFRTTDRGEWRDGRLVVLGRLDDVVTVNGVNVSLGAVEAVVRTELGVRDVAVVAASDTRRGARIVAYVEMSDPAGLPAIAPLVAERLGGAARPEVVPVDALPHLPNGKIDRRALVERAARD
ncbi:MAG: AMP-binding enzyme, partial [Actinomycetota bacterium]